MSPPPFGTDCNGGERFEALRPLSVGHHVFACLRCCDCVRVAEGLLQPLIANMSFTRAITCVIALLTIITGATCTLCSGISPASLWVLEPTALPGSCVYTMTIDLTRCKFTVSPVHVATKLQYTAAHIRASVVLGMNHFVSVSAAAAVVRGLAEPWDCGVGTNRIVDNDVVWTAWPAAADGGVYGVPQGMCALAVPAPGWEAYSFCSTPCAMRTWSIDACDTASDPSGVRNENLYLVSFYGGGAGEYLQGQYGTYHFVPAATAGSGVYLRYNHGVCAGFWTLPAHIIPSVNGWVQSKAVVVGPNAMLPSSSLCIGLESAAWVSHGVLGEMHAYTACTHEMVVDISACALPYAPLHVEVRVSDAVEGATTSQFDAVLTLRDVTATSFVVVNTLRPGDCVPVMCPSGGSLPRHVRSTGFVIAT